VVRACSWLLHTRQESTRLIAAPMNAGDDILGAAVRHHGVLALLRRTVSMHAGLLVPICATAGVDTAPPACSMNFGHRVKSMTLGDFKTEELDQMRDAGNLVRCPSPTDVPPTAASQHIHNPGMPRRVTYLHTHAMCTT
jgi:hypothetical protein